MQALDAPGAVQLGILRRIFLARKGWWQLVPDQSIFADGGRTDGTVLNLAARHRDGRWIMVYLGSPSSVSVQMNRVASWRQASASWIDPRTGDSVAIRSLATSDAQAFTTPEGWEDALLVIE